VLTKFQQELQVAIAEWHNAMNRCKDFEGMEELRRHEGRKLERLLLRVADKKTIKRRIYETKTL
jgi:hypothetical protein